MTPLRLVLLPLFTLACASATPAAPTDVPPLPPDVAPSPDVMPPTDVPTQHDVTPADMVLHPAPPIEAPSETWTWIPVEGSACGNGSTAGIGVNLTQRSNRVLIYLQGGGGCWDALTCHLLNTATNLNVDYTENLFRREIATTGRGLIFSRSDMRNPFRDASFVYVPYCTGDIHGGDRVMTYDVGGQMRRTHHVGARNMGLYLRRLAATLPATERVWLTGISAGGYGAGIHWDRVQRAFSRARVDLLDDSGPPITPPMARYESMKAAWNLQFPEGCTRCNDDLGALFPYYRTRFMPPHRMGLLSYTQDRTISTYFGISGSQFEMGLNDLTRTSFDATPNFRYFIVTGTNHTMLGSLGTVTGPGGASLLAWVTAWATDASPWENVRP